MTETIQYKEYSINIERDENAQNPREDENITTMLFFHKRYTLGDYNENKAYIRECESRCRSRGELLKKIKKDFNPPVISEVYMYDHSMISLSLRGDVYPYNDRWDAGFLGYILIPEERFKKEFGRKTQKNIALAKNILLSEFTVYDEYIRGEVFGYIAESSEEEFIGSCWGFYGHNHEKSGLLEEAKNEIDSYIEQKYCQKMRDETSRYSQLVVEGMI